MADKIEAPLEALTRIYGEWLKQQSLPEQCALELMQTQTLTRPQYEWLRAFVAIWDYCEANNGWTARDGSLRLETERDMYKKRATENATSCNQLALALQSNTTRIAILESTVKEAARQADSLRGKLQEAQDEAKKERLERMDLEKILADIGYKQYTIHERVMNYYQVWAKDEDEAESLHRQNRSKATGQDSEPHDIDVEER